MSKPLTNEQIWGTPKEPVQKEIDTDYCPYKKNICVYWDPKEGCIMNGGKCCITDG